VARKETQMRIQLLSFAALVLLTLCIWGYEKIATQPSKPMVQSGGSKINKSIDQNKPSDESLMLEQYIRLGLAAHDREWFGDDMVKAEKVLSSLAEKESWKLPRYKSERSGEVFARMTSPQNLEFLRNRNLPFDVRFPQALNYCQSSSQILKLYVSAFLEKNVSDSELVELMGAMFRISVVMLELVDEFLPTLNNDDPNYQVRLKGLEQMKRGLAGIVGGGIQTLRESESYRVSELARLVAYMQEAFPLIVPRLLPGARLETMTSLEKMQVDPNMKGLQPGLGELYLKIKISLEKGKAP